MKVNFNTVVRNFDGTALENPIYKLDSNGCRQLNEKQEPIFERLEPILVKKFVFELLGAAAASDKLSGEQKMKQYVLAGKIAAAGADATDINSDDVAVLTGVLDNAAPLVYGVVKTLLNPPGPQLAQSSAA